MKSDLNRKISGFDEFKLVMETIGRIQSTTISIEIELHEMQETFSVLEDHKIQVRKPTFIFYHFFFVLHFYLFIPSPRDYSFVDGTYHLLLLLLWGVCA